MYVYIGAACGFYRCPVLIQTQQNESVELNASPTRNHNTQHNTAHRHGPICDMYGLYMTPLETRNKH
jgi:hypothetical protein